MGEVDVDGAATLRGLVMLLILGAAGIPICGVPIPDLSEIGFGIIVAGGLVLVAVAGLGGRV